ncbi:MAG: ATP-binding protein [Chitinivibrionales bacterium]
MIPRACTRYLRKLAQNYPVITITGPRQSGKTTLAKAVFLDKPYASLENLDTLDFAERDTRGFLAHYKNGAIFDEAQRCPALFSYLQQIVDEGPKHCRFVLTGSQQFGLRSRITQSLAGRSANCVLLPFTYKEIFGGTGGAKPDMETVLFNGLYPPVHDRNLDPSTWYANYVENYVERDVRRLINIHELRTFQLFLKMCASRCGQLLNISGLASDCGISVNTAKGWISVLEASYIVFLLQPYFGNFGKRLIKTPKLYFYDTGILSYLLSIHNVETMATHSMRGPIFESFVVSEIKKHVFNNGNIDTLYFWRDKAGLEIDLVMEAGEILESAEIKSGKTISTDFFDGLLKWKAIAGKKAGPLTLIFGGELAQKRSDVHVISWRYAESAFAS